MSLLRPLLKLLVAPSAWTPSYLFTGAVLGVWYDPSDISSLYQDSAGTVPVTADGQPVGLMLDKSGNGNHARMASASSRPTFRDDGTYKWLDFDGTNDHMVMDGRPTTAGVATSFHYAYTSDASGTRAVLGSSAASDVEDRFVGERATGNYTQQFGTISDGPSHSRSKLVRLDIANAGTNELYINGALVATLSSGTDYDFRHLMASYKAGAPAFFTDGKLYGVVIYPSATKSGKLDTYLGAKVGLAL